jgi:hypothetical protein
VDTISIFFNEKTNFSDGVREHNLRAWVLLILPSSAGPGKALWSSDRNHQHGLLHSQALGDHSNRWQKHIAFELCCSQTPQRHRFVLASTGVPLYSLGSLPSEVWIFRGEPYLISHFPTIELLDQKSWGWSPALCASPSIPGDYECTSLRAIDSSRPLPFIHIGIPTGKVRKSFSPYQKQVQHQTNTTCKFPKTLLRYFQMWEWT